MKRTIIIAGALLVASCGGGGGGDTPPPPAPPVQNAAVGGIWTGTLGSGQQLVGIVTESGEFHFLANDGVQYFGNASTSVNAVSGSFTAYTAFGTAFQDNTTSGTGTLSGTVNARSTFSANTTFRTSAGNSNNNTVTLTFNQLYNRDSSLATIAGNFRDLDSGAIANINANGAAFLQDPTTGCVINGTVSIIDSQFNAYRVQYTYSSCQGQFATLNGVTFRGLATLDNTVSPEQLVVGAQGRAGNVGISAITVFART